MYIFIFKFVLGISISNLQRNRQCLRKKGAAKLKAAFNESHLWTGVNYWNGKLLHSVLVTGEVEQFPGMAPQRAKNKFWQFMKF